MTETDKLSSLEPRISFCAWKYRSLLPDVDLEQEFRINMLKIIRNNPDRDIDELQRMSYTILRRAAVDLFRQRHGRDPSKEHELTKYADPETLYRGRGRMNDPAILAAIQEAINDIRGMGVTETTVINALLNPPPSFAVARNGRRFSTVSMREISDYYRLKPIEVKCALSKIKRRLAEFGG